MNKRKYIEKKSSKRSSWNPYGYNRQKAKYIDPDNLPRRESMRYNSRKCWETHRNFVNWDHMKKYFKSKVGEHWDDVYSDMLSKLKEKYKYEYRENTKWEYFLETNIVFIDGLPHSLTTRYKYQYSVLVNDVFVDENKILSYYETKDDLINEYRLRLRRKKLSNIMNEEY